MEVLRRTVLQGAAGITAAALMPPATSHGQQKQTPVSEEAPRRTPQSPLHFANLNQQQRHRYTAPNDLVVIKQPDHRTDETALDYSHEEVREHRLGVMREITGNYEVDGLELNFVRRAKQFPRDRGREKAPAGGGNSPGESGSSSPASRPAST